MVRFQKSLVMLGVRWLILHTSPPPLFALSHFGNYVALCHLFKSSSIDAASGYDMNGLDQTLISESWAQSESFYVQIIYISVSSGGEFLIRFKVWFNRYIMDQVPSLRRLGRYNFLPYFRQGWKGGQQLIEISDPWKVWSNLIRFHSSLKKQFYKLSGDRIKLCNQTFSNQIALHGQFGGLAGLENW